MKIKNILIGLLIFLIFLCLITYWRMSRRSFLAAYALEKLYSLEKEFPETEKDINSLLDSYKVDFKFDTEPFVEYDELLEGDILEKFDNILNNNDYTIYFVNPNFKNTILSKKLNNFNSNNQIWFFYHPGFDGKMDLNNSSEIFHLYDPTNGMTSEGDLFYFSSWKDQ